MSILADWEIRALCDGGMVSPFLTELINPASLDVRLGTVIMIEQAGSSALRRVDLAFEQFTAQSPFLLMPKQFILAEMVEKFHLPATVVGQFMLKSSRAREGIEHLMAGYFDPGYEGRPTLELVNSRELHAVPLWPGMKIGQVVFHRMSAKPLRTYADTGRYQGHTGVSASLG